MTQKSPITAYSGGGGWGYNTKALPREVQQLRLLPKVDINLIFDTLGRTQYLILIALERRNEKNCELEWKKLRNRTLSGRKM